MLSSNSTSEILDKELEKGHDTGLQTPRSDIGEFPAVVKDSVQKDKQENDTSAPKEGKEPHVDIIPNGGYGWVCVATCFVINAHTWGMNSVRKSSMRTSRKDGWLADMSQSYGVFLNYYLNNKTFPNASRVAYAFIGGLSMAMAGLISPIITIIIRKFGTRTALLIGVFFQTISFIGASFATQIWQLVLSQGICFGFGLGFLFVGSVGVVPQWFSTRRSLANGIAAAGSGFGGLIYSLATNAMIQRIGLAWAFRVLGIISFVVNFVCAILLKDRNQQVGSSHLAFDFRLFKRLEFWALLGFGVFSLLGYVVVLFSIPNYAHQIGLSAKQGSVIGAVLNLGQGLGRPPIGLFSDSVGKINMAGVMTFLSGFLVLVVWINAKSYEVSRLGDDNYYTETSRFLYSMLWWVVLSRGRIGPRLDLSRQRSLD